MVLSGPSLKHFLLRQQVINLYRNAIRASQAIVDPVTRKETLAWIRSELERQKNLTDTTVIEDRLGTIRRELKFIMPCK